MTSVKYIIVQGGSATELCNIITNSGKTTSACEPTLENEITVSNPEDKIPEGLKEEIKRIAKEHSGRVFELKIA